jgi:hypothetical protein
MKLEFPVEKIFSISRRIFWGYLPTFFLLGWLLNELSKINILKWLGFLSLFIGGIAWILLGISCSMPGILILLGTPWLSRSWLHGINSIVISDTPWEQLSSWQKFLTYFWALAIFGFTLLAILGLILQASRM